MLGHAGAADRDIASARTALAAQISTMRQLQLDDEAEQVVGAVVLTALDRRFLHGRPRTSMGRPVVDSSTVVGTSPLAELAMIVDALCHHDGVMTEDPRISYDSAVAVLGFPIGATVRLTVDSVEHLGAAVIDQVAREVDDESTLL